jgi:hypothetical protein
MWQSLPVDVQFTIIDYIPGPMWKYKDEAKEPIVKSHELSSRLVNRMFAERLKYQIDLYQTGDISKFVRTALKQTRIRIQRTTVQTLTPEFYSWVSEAVYSLCTSYTSFNSVPYGVSLYEVLHKEFPFEFYLVSPLERERYMKLILHLFEYLNRTSVHQRAGSLQSSLKKSCDEFRPLHEPLLPYTGPVIKLAGLSWEDIRLLLRSR